MEELFATLTKDFVEETKPLVDEVTRLLLQLESVGLAQGDTREIMRGIRSGLHSIKGNSSMMGLGPIERTAHGLEDFTSWVETHVAHDLSGHVQVLLDGCDVLGRLILSTLDGAVDERSAEGVTSNLKARMHGEPDAAANPNMGGLLGGAMTVVGKEAFDTPETIRTVRVQDSVMDELLEGIGDSLVGHGELQRIQTRFSHGTIETADIDLMGRILDTLHRESSRMRERLLTQRLEPIGSLFRRFTRSVRDLAREHGQPIHLAIDGAEVAVDRAVTGRLFEPLVHLVRNAVAHGIEPPAERAMKGKPSTARILLGARVTDGRVRILVADDGRGLDRQAIVAKAKNQGLEVDRLSDREIDRLIFQAGLSTARHITALAGRGVGLDVVATAVQSLGGTLDVRSTVGQGTVFILEVPVTISRQTVLVFGVDSEIYAVPTGFVEETLLANANDLSDVDNETRLVWRGMPVPVADAGRLLGCQGLFAEWIRPYVLVLRTGNQRAALLLDWLAPVQEMVIKPFDPLFQDNRLMVGAAVTGQGRVVPVINCLEVVQRTRSFRIPKSAYVPEEGSYHVF